MKVALINPQILELVIDNEAETVRLGQALASVARPGVVIGLVGTLGAGKTRLVRALSEALGVEPGSIASPTFVLIHEYAGTLPIYHFDAYRLDDTEAFDALGASDYWAGGEGICLVEWADLVADRLPSTCWWVRIELDGMDGRKVKIESPEAERIALCLLELSSSSG